MMKLELENADPPLARRFVDDQLQELPRVVAVCSFLFLQSLDSALACS